MGRFLAILFVVGCGSSSSSPWKEQSVPTPSALSAYTVWVAGENDVWLGGTAIWHFDGTAWSERSPMTCVDFWGFSPNDIWAINESKVARWNGSTWTEVPPTAGVSMVALWRIWGSSSSDMWIANQDNSRVYHYNGTSWTVTTLQFVMADALWGANANDIWLSGTTDLYHYTGTWQKYEAIDEPPSVEGLWGFAPNDVWAAGGFDGLSHWNGSSWTPEEEVEDYNALWGSAPNDVWAVGGNGMVAHFDGSDWSESRVLDVRTNFYTVHGSSPDNIWATATNLAEQKALVLKYEP